MSTYSPLHQTNSTEREYGSNQNTVGYEYFPITNFRPPLKYSGSKLVQPDDYLFISTGEYGVPKLFGQLKNYNFTSSGPGYTALYWKKAKDEKNNILNVPPKLIFEDVDDELNPKYYLFVERPINDDQPPINDDEPNKTCFGSLCKFFSGSGTKRRKKSKNKRRKSRKQKKQRKTKKRRKH